MADNEKLLGNTASDSSPEEEDSGIIIIYDDDVPSDEEVEREEQRVFERIQARQSNVQTYDPSEQTTAQKISNFWYRNKTLVIIAFVAVLMIAYLTITTWPEKYDCEASVYVSASDYPASITYEVQGEIEKYIGDADGNGECNVLVHDFNVAGENGFLVMANYTLMQDHLQNKPMSMLWVVDKELFDMMVEAYGEELFESFEGAPLWIELTSNEVINGSIALGETPRLGLCLRRLTDDLAKDKGLRSSYEQACALLENLREEHPEMFEPQQ